MELPEECIAMILSRTTPVDVARLSVVSKSFWSAAGFDVVWDHFIPSEYHSIISETPSLAMAPSKKALYVALSDHPVIIDHGTKSIQLDKETGKKGYMLAARALSIARDPVKIYWDTSECNSSRFGEVAVLNNVWELQIVGMINTLFLSPNTHYGAFFVFKIKRSFYEDDVPVELSISIVGGGHHGITKIVKVFEGGGINDLGLDPFRRPSLRSDGWLEIDMGVFFNSGLENEQVQISVTGNISTWVKFSDLVLEGIEVRPTNILRFNVGGASLSNPGKSGIGGILRNDKGEILGCFSMFIGEGWWEHEAKVHAISNALYFCSKFNFRNVIIESDSIMAVGWETNTREGERSSRLKCDLEVIKIYANGVNCLEIKYVPPERNQLADALAKQGCHGQSTLWALGKKS